MTGVEIFESINQSLQLLNLKNPSIPGHLHYSRVLNYCRLGLLDAHGY